MYDIMYSAFLALYNVVKTSMQSYMISLFWLWHPYDIIKTIIICLSCTILLWFRPRYHIHFIQFSLWYLNYRISDLTWPTSMILPLISVLPCTYAIWCRRFDDISAYVMAPVRRDGADWGLQALGGSRIAIANVLGTGVQLNKDSLDPAHGLVDAAPMLSRGRLVVIQRRKFSCWT